MGLGTADACGTVIWEAAEVSLVLLRAVAANLAVRSLLGSLGSFGVGLKRSGLAI